MQIHTFIAESASQAVDQIRAELGPAAVVLSVRKLPRTGFERFLKQEQIEVLAGLDEIAPPAPAAKNTPDSLAELREEIRELRNQVAHQHVSRIAPPCPSAERKPIGIAHILNQTGLLPAFSEQIVQEISGTDHLPIAEQIAKASAVLRGRWRPADAATAAGVHVFVGAPGSGKSTVLCKMLAQTSLVEGQPATVYQLDSHVANPSPQPAVYAEIVGAQYERTAPLNFERREESVFVDVPGVALGNDRVLEQLQRVVAEFGVPEIHLVLNAAYESAHLLEQVRFFSRLGISDLIVTHLDEETRWGKLWNLVLGTNFSMRSLCAGQNIPGDFHQATPEALLARQFRGK